MTGQLQRQRRSCEECVQRPPAGLPVSPRPARRGTRGPCRRTFVAGPAGKRRLRIAPAPRPRGVALCSWRTARQSPPCYCSPFPDGTGIVQTGCRLPDRAESSNLAESATWATKGQSRRSTQIPAFNRLQPGCKHEAYCLPLSAGTASVNRGPLTVGRSNARRRSGALSRPLWWRVPLKVSAPALNPNSIRVPAISPDGLESSVCAASTRRVVVLGH